MDQLTLAIASVAWGLVTLAGVAHAADLARLRGLLARHTDHDLLAAISLLAVEGALAAGFVVGVATGTGLAIAGLLISILGFGFSLWVGRLLLVDDDLPCACSFSAAPASAWSLARAGLVVLGSIAMLADVNMIAIADRLGALAAGGAVAGGAYVLPEALGWPEASRAHLARGDAHATASASP